MTKREFIKKLRAKLSDFPSGEVEERLNFYSEMIDDKIEEGVLEETAVDEIGCVEDIACQIRAERGTIDLPKQKNRSPRRLKGWEIVLLVLGAPIWLSLLIAAVAVLASVLVTVFAVLFSAVISLWAAELALCASVLGGGIGGIVFICGGKTTTGLVLIGAVLVCAGLSVLLYYACKAATNGVCVLIKKCAFWLKKLFKKEAK